MIIFDLSQVVISTAFELNLYAKDQTLSEDLLRHAVIQKILAHKKKYKKYSDEVIIAADNKNYWRREIFPEYKHHRQKLRNDSDLNWDLIFSFMKQFKEEIREYFSYKLIDVHGAEADDVMYVLGKTFGLHDKVILISSDKDMLQLQVRGFNVTQYSPYHKKEITPKNQKYSFIEHIVCGDSGDGIPNVFSDSDTFLIEGKRQKPIKKTLLELLKPCKSIKDAKVEIDIIGKNYFDRNDILINMENIPENVKYEILKEKETKNIIPKKPLMNYLVQKRLAKLLERIKEF